MNKQEFKTRWESDESGGGITFGDVADCAKAWGLFNCPRACPMDAVLYRVLIAAEVDGAEGFRPEKAAEQ